MSPKMITDHHIRTLTDALTHVLEDDDGARDGHSLRNSASSKNAQTEHVNAASIELSRV